MAGGPAVNNLARRLSRFEGGAALIEIPDLYDELHALAVARFRGQRPGHTLRATALVHEAWMRIAGRDDSSFRDRSHFMSVAARAMRHVLVDHARRSKAA